MPRVLVVYDPNCPALTMSVFELPDDPEAVERLKEQVETDARLDLGAEPVLVETALL